MVAQVLHINRAFYRRMLLVKVTKVNVAELISEIYTNDILVPDEAVQGNDGWYVFESKVTEVKLKEYVLIRIKHSNDAHNAFPFRFTPVKDTAVFIKE